MRFAPSDAPASWRDRTTDSDLETIVVEGDRVAGVRVGGLDGPGVEDVPGARHDANGRILLQQALEIGGRDIGVVGDDDAGIDGFVLLVLRQMVPDMGAVRFDHFDCRTGGAYRITMSGQDMEGSVHGSFHDVPAKFLMREMARSKSQLSVVAQKTETLRSAS